MPSTQGPSLVSLAKKPPSQRPEIPLQNPWGPAPIAKRNCSTNVEAAYAVRCSMSIPLVFTPQSNQGIRAFDGGLQNNFPVETLLGDDPAIPFIGLFLGPETYKPIKQGTILKDIILIWTEASDADVVRKYRDQVIVIDPSPIGTLDFSLSEDEKAFLIAAGEASALGHLEPNSSLHDETINLRDELKTTITEQRKRQRGQKRWCRILVLLAIVGVIFWWYFS